MMKGQPLDSFSHHLIQHCQLNLTTQPMGQFNHRNIIYLNLLTVAIVRVINTPPPLEFIIFLLRARLKKSMILYQFLKCLIMRMICLLLKMKTQSMIPLKLTYNSVFMTLMNISLLSCAQSYLKTSTGIVEIQLSIFQRSLMKSRVLIGTR